MPDTLKTVDERKEKVEQDTARLNSQILGNDDRSDPFVAAVRATRMPMIITNPRLPDNPAVFINDAFCRMSGYTRDEILGRNCRFLQGPETDPATVQQIRGAVDAVRSIQLDIRNHRKDGSAFWNRLLMAPVHDAEGNLAYFFASQVDVTLERERLTGLENDNAALLVELTDRLRRQEDAEQQLRELNQNLAEQVETEVAGRLKTEELLRQAQKMEAVGQLTGGLAHDFNNLLTGITGSLELMQRRVQQGRFDDLARYTDAARDAAARASALTHRLLAFSRRQTLAPTPTRINQLAAGMEELIRRTIGTGIDLEFITGEDMWLTLADQSQLENSLLNLCINARDAMPDGGKLTVECQSLALDAGGAALRDLDPGHYVTLAVSDNGTGMPPDVAARAFDPFYTTKPLGQGTGLGLSMIYGFTRQSGGQARIHSVLGQGTTVRLYLPRHHGDVAAEVMEDEDAHAELTGGETVLVVDDEATVQMLVSDVLTEAGYEVLQADTGMGGLQILQTAAKVSLLVTDVGLPGGMNGRQLADAARNTRPELKVLFITGYAEAAVLSHGHLDPGMHILTKPFAMIELSRRIREILDTE